MLIAESLGGISGDILECLTEQIVDLCRRGPNIDALTVNFTFSVIREMKPRGVVEVMLAAQMAAVHFSTMKLAGQLAIAANIPQQDAAERALNELARTYVGQMEALKRSRTGGEQKITIQRVSVNDGGKAIVGNVTRAQRDAKPDQETLSSHAIERDPTHPIPITDERVGFDQVPSGQKQPRSIPDE